MRIAISAMLFDDSTRMGSQRARSLAPELANLGNDVTVFTHGPPRDHPEQTRDGYQIIRLGEYSDAMWPRTGPMGLARKLLIAAIIAPTVIPLARARRATAREETREAAELRITELDAMRKASILRVDQVLSVRLWTTRARKLLRMSKPEIQPFDVVFGSRDALTPTIRNMGIAKKWVADYRDPDCSPSFLPLVNRYLQAHQDWTLRSADRTTVISSGVKTALTRSRTGAALAEKIQVVPNGFRPRRPSPKPPPTGPAPLRVGYTGAISYPQRREGLRTALAAMRAVVDRHGTPIELHYAGPGGEEVADAARQTGAMDLVKLHGELTHGESLALQESMDALLALSWNTKQDQGVLSGKFLEYLGADRPIITLVGGELPGSELAQMSALMNVGPCFEKAIAGSDDELEEWLRVASSTRASGDPLPWRPESRFVSRYSYPQIAEELQSLFERL